MLTLYHEAQDRFFQHYFLDFYLSLEDEDQEKVEYVHDIVKNLQWIPKKFLKHIEGTDGYLKFVFLPVKMNSEYSASLILVCWLFY